MSQDVVHRVDGALLWVGRAIDEPADSRQHHRAGTHRAGLERDIERDRFQPPGLRQSSRLVEHEHLRVRGRVGGRFDQVVGFGKEVAVADQDGTHRNLTNRGGAAGLRQRALNVMYIVVLTGR